MVRVILEDGEEALEKEISKFGRIDGLKRYVGRRAKIVVLKEKKGE
jgi:putative transposon-encoded protein